MKQHPAYKAAKSGDGVAAICLVTDVMNDEQNRKLQALLPSRKPILVSAHAYEREGINAIPEIFADVLARLAGP